MNNSFNIKTKILMLVKGSSRSLSPNYVDFRTQNDHHILGTQSNPFQTHIFLVSVLGATLIHPIPLKYKYPHPNKQPIELGTPTLV